MVHITTKMKSHRNSSGQILLLKSLMSVIVLMVAIAYLTCASSNSPLSASSAHSVANTTSVTNTSTNISTIIVNKLNATINRPHALEKSPIRQNKARRVSNSSSTTTLLENAQHKHQKLTSSPQNGMSSNNTQHQATGGEIRHNRLAHQKPKEPQSHRHVGSATKTRFNHSSISVTQQQQAMKHLFPLDQLPHMANTPPVFMASREFFVSRDDPVGTRITTIKTKDDDQDQIDYSIQEALVHDGSKYFHINRRTGELTTASKFPSPPLPDPDADNNNTVDYYIVIVADDGHIPAKMEFVVRVLDNSTTSNNQLSSMQSNAPSMPPPRTINNLTREYVSRLPGYDPKQPHLIPNYVNAPMTLPWNFPPHNDYHSDITIIHEEDTAGGPESETNQEQETISKSTITPVEHNQIEDNQSRLNVHTDRSSNDENDLPQVGKQNNHSDFNSNLYGFILLSSVITLVVITAFLMMKKVTVHPVLQRQISSKSEDFKDGISTIPDSCDFYDASDNFSSGESNFTSSILHEPLSNQSSISMTAASMIESNFNHENKCNLSRNTNNNSIEEFLRDHTMTTTHGGRVYVQEDLMLMNDSASSILGSYYSQDTERSNRFTAVSNHQSPRGLSSPVNSCTYQSIQANECLYDKAYNAASKSNRNPIVESTTDAFSTLRSSNLTTLFNRVGTKTLMPETGSVNWAFPRHKLLFKDMLGEGEFGQVWRCLIEEGEGRKSQVAVKTLKRGLGLNERENLLAEIEIMKLLNKHPNVVQMLGCCIEANEPIYLIMELINKGKLSSYLRKSRRDRSYNNLHGTSDRLTAKDLIKFSYHIAKGMEYVSSRGIIHRDLAARNILVTSNKVCKVADFGFARKVDVECIYERKSNDKVPVRWMAPESLNYNKYTNKSDVYSFGVLMWEIVTLGATPYDDLTASEVMKEVRQGKRLPRPDHCVLDLYNIMSKCWMYDPEDRPTFGMLASVLNKLLLSENEYIELEQYPDHSYYNILTDLSGEKL